MCECYPIDVAKSRFLTKCEKLKDLGGGSLHQENRYHDGLRSSETICWIWGLKMAIALMEQGETSTVVVYEVNRFIMQHKRRIIFTLN